MPHTTARVQRATAQRRPLWNAQSVLRIAEDHLNSEHSRGQRHERARGRRWAVPAGQHVTRRQVLGLARWLLSAWVNGDGE